MTNSRDVQLVIKARDDATKAFDTVRSAAERLIAVQKSGGDSSVANSAKTREMARAVGDLEKAFASVTKSADRGDAAYNRQAAGLDKTKSKLTAVEAEIKQVARALETLPTSIVDVKLEGGDTSRLVSSLREAKQEMKSLIAERTRLKGQTLAGESALGISENGLLQLGAHAKAAKVTLTDLGKSSADLLKVADGMERAEKAAKLLSDSTTRIKIEKVTGVERPAELTALVALYREQEQQEARLAASAERLRNQIDPMRVATANYNKELAHARALKQQNIITDIELGKAEQMLAANLKAVEDQLGRAGSNGKPLLLGMSPYQVQNLSYQVNDVVTQLASGTPIMQVFAQQGGQILQSFESVGPKIISALGNPRTLALLGLTAGAITAVALVAGKAVDEAARLRVFEGYLISLGQESRNTAAGLSDAAKSLTLVGVESDKANAIIQKLVREGIAPERIKEFALAGANMAEVLGGDATSAAERLTNAFDGSLRSLEQFQSQTGLFTQEEMLAIRIMFEHGETAKALDSAFDVLSRRMEESATKQRGPWAEASRSMTKAWDGFLSSIANSSAIEATGEVLSGYAQTIRDTIVAIEDLTEAELKQKISQARTSLRQVQPSDDPLDALDERAKAYRTRLESQIAELEAQLKKITDARQKSLREGQSAEQRDRDNTATRELDRQRRLLQARSDTDRVRIEAEQTYQEAIEAGHSKEVAFQKTQLVYERARAAERKRAAQQAEQDAKKLRDLTQFGAPTTGGRTSSEMGWRTDPINGQRKRHSGIDYSRDRGTSVYATADGVVSFSGRSGRGDGRNGTGYGNLIKLNHGAGTETRYGHLEIRLVSDGEAVKKGQLIGKVGSTGRSTGPHLHYEVRRNGTAVNPNQNGSRFETSINAATAEAEKQEEKALENQQQFDERFDRELVARERAVSLQTQLVGLSGSLLLTKQREQAVSQAAFDAQQQAAEKDLVLSADRLVKIQAIAGQEWDIANAREMATGGVDAANAERQALLSRLQDAIDTGDTAKVTELKAALAGVDDSLKAAIDSAVTFWKKFDTPESRTALSQLETLRGSIGRTQQDLLSASLQRPVEQLKTARSEIMAQIEFFQQQGQGGAVEALRANLKAVDEQLLSAIDNLMEFWRTSSSPDAANTLLNLQNLRNSILAGGVEFQVAAQQMQQAFAGSLTQSVNTWVAALGAGRNAIGATWNLFRGFAADFFSQVSQMVLQQAALQLASKIGFKSPADKLTGVLNGAPLMAAGAVLSGAGTSLTVGGTTLTTAGGTLLAASAAWSVTATQLQFAAATLMAANAASAGGGGGAEAGVGNAASWLAGLFHTGGIAGSASQSRTVYPGLFNGATRYHLGGIAGLMPGEIPAILQCGEEILTKDDPRHIFNGGGGASAPAPVVNVKTVNVFDPADALERALSTTVGEQVLVNHVRKHGSTLRAALDS